MTLKTSPTRKTLNCQGKLGLTPMILIGVSLIIGGIFLAKSAVIRSFEARFAKNEAETNYLDQKVDVGVLPSNQPSAAISPTQTLTPPAGFTQIKAVKIANAPDNACTNLGQISTVETYNPNSQTWWFKLLPTQPKPGCNPACVVHLNGNIEVNWRCTGVKTETPIAP